MTQPITLVVSEDSAPDRLDRYLALHAPELSRTRAKEIITKGLVTLNGRPGKPSARLEPNDVIVAVVPELETLRAAPEKIPIDVCYEDDDLIVIDKTPGMVMHPAPGAVSGTLVNALLGRGSPLSSVGGDLRPGIVHRLDRDTSGLVVVAKNDVAHRKLSAAFEGRRVSKEYLSVVWGTFREAEGTIDAPIGRHRKDRKKMAVRSDGRPAVTRWLVREQFPYAALLALTPETGRTHQIRVHMAHVNRPVVGDAEYGAAGPLLDGVPPAERTRAKTLDALAARQALHARRLSFDHPSSGARVSFASPIPADFAALLSHLRHPGGELGRVLGIDPGDARIGVAVSDEGRVLARSLHTLQGLADEEAAGRIAVTATELGALTVVVGHPIRMDGTSGPRAARARELAVAIEDAAPVRVVLWDERLSSVEAERIMAETGERVRGRKGRVDTIAAAVILQSYLNATGRQAIRREGPTWI